MSTVAEPVPRRSRTIDRKTLAGIASAIATLGPGPHIHLTGVNWDDYRYLLDASERAGRRAVRITYFRGEIEIMVTSSIHEQWKKILGSLLEEMARELGVAYRPFGNMTIDQTTLDAGFEPDECYYLGESVAPIWAIATERALDFDRDPAPDLAIEIEYTRNIVRRLPLYATLGIKEIWRSDAGETLTILNLDETGTYREVSKFLYFPAVPPAEVLRFLTIGSSVMDLGAFLNQFREYLRTLAAK